jgi:hypothetical protein
MKLPRESYCAEADMTPLIVAVMLVTVILGALSMFASVQRREMEHKERMAALERGQPLPPVIPPELLVTTKLTPRDYLRRGLLWLFTGIGLFIAVYSAAATLDAPHGEDLARFAFAGLVPTAVGIAYIIFYVADPDRQ